MMSGVSLNSSSSSSFLSLLHRNGNCRKSQYPSSIIFANYSHQLPYQPLSLSFSSATSRSRRFQRHCSSFPGPPGPGLPGVLSVKPDPDTSSVGKDYSTFDLQGNLVSKSPSGSTLLFPEGSKPWLVCVDKPSTGISSKAQAVDFFVNTLTRALGNEKDAQMCLYHVSWESDFEFCCQLDDESAQELAAVPGVLSVQPDEQFEPESKAYGGNRLLSDAPDSTQTTEISKTKLFITGLSFYTSEKTLRAAFEPFGELMEVKVIMDKISKRSKGYAFVEYTTEEAATTALQEMNGKIINGWMIVVDRAKSTPRVSKGRRRPPASPLQIYGDRRSQIL